MKSGIFRFVRYHDVADYERLGWVHDPRPLPAGHDDWSVVCWWLCDCLCVEPVVVSSRRGSATRAI